VTGSRTPWFFLFGLVCMAPALAQTPATKGVLTWEALGQAGIVKKGERYVPEYPKDVAALDRKEVKLQGFMMPLEVGATQKRFLLSAQPSDCAYCVPSGPEGLVEVQAKTPVKYGMDPIQVTGKFVLVRDDASGLFYRLTEATVSDK
jgi:hypothetical protein